MPLADGEAEAESVYEWLRRSVQAPVQPRRILRLEWQHDGEIVVCEVGKPMPEHYELGVEPVLAIFDTENCYMICTPSRGVDGTPVIANHGLVWAATYFES